MSRRRDWKLFDIVMFEREEWTTKTWIGYVSDPSVDEYGYISVIWWDEVLLIWTLSQNVPAHKLDFIGEVEI